MSADPPVMDRAINRSQAARDGDSSLNGSAQVNGAISRFASVRQGARRFHLAEIGKGVDPDNCLAHWLWCASRGDHAAIRKAYGEQLDREFGHDLDCTGTRSKAAMAVSPGGAFGGYLVPQELRDDIMWDVSEESFVRPEAWVVPMTSQTLLLPLPDAVTATGAVGVPPFWGSMQMQWTIEAAAINETEPRFRQLELRANELTGLLVGSNTFKQDALGLEAWLRRMIARSVAWYEDYAFLRGNGVGQPTGMETSGSAITVGRSTPNTVKYVDMAAMLSDLLPYSYLHAAWYMTVSAMVQVVQLIDASGKTAWVPNYPPNLDGDGKGSRSVGQVFGRPTYVTEKLPVLGTQGDIMLADPSLYVIGDRQALEIAVSEHPKFNTNQTEWRVVHRVDGKPFFDGAITLSDQATKVSNIVLLK